MSQTREGWRRRRADTDWPLGIMAKAAAAAALIPPSQKLGPVGIRLGLRERERGTDDADENKVDVQTERMSE